MNSPFLINLKPQDFDGMMGLQFLSLIKQFNRSLRTVQLLTLKSIINGGRLGQAVSDEDVHPGPGVVNLLNGVATHYVAKERK